MVQISPDDKFAVAAKNCCGIGIEWNIFLYLGWIPRYLELFSKIRKTRKILQNLTVPCKAFQSVKDEMVAKSSIGYLKKHSEMTVYELKNSSHNYYQEDDLGLVKNEFKDMLRRISADK